MTTKAVVLVVSITLLPRESTGIFVLRYGTCRSLEIAFMLITTSGLGYLLVLLLDLGFYFTKLKNVSFMTIFQCNWASLQSNSFILSI